MIMLQKEPKAIAIGTEPKTVNNAYPPDNKAIIDVKTTVIPIDSYLYLSVKQISLDKISWLAPADQIRNFCKMLSLILFVTFKPF